MTATIHEVAKEAGVSISTVSRSFTHPELVSEKTKTAVLDIANTLGFSISRSATALKSGVSLRIALLLSDRLGSWFNSAILEGLNSVLHPAGYDISIFQIDSSSDRKSFFDTLPTRRNADAVIVASFDVADTEIERLNTLKVPIIGINSATHNVYNASVRINDELGAMLAFKHVFSLGHRNIVYVQTDPMNSLFFSVQQRKDSFVECCKDASLDPRVLTASASGNRISDVLTQLFTLDSMPTAVICQEDGLAIPLMFQMARSGIRVPRDVSVIGFDDGIYAKDTGLTTIRQDPLAMARTAARMTLELIDGELPNNPQRIFEPQLMLRSSTDVVRA
ncbi:MAG: LacI family transcriptional regulator [Bifidobacterium crudilactis]|jgi:LacI family transcriptional regulator, repressor for deo operon, udp, cdd, tsx, nupC, and nupG|uniref:LacI family DNA-binding transcriptional regulator n=1 Tax=Bifidobacterium crudilactis TaxID=327277 RepID=UPI003A5C2550